MPDTTIYHDRGAESEAERRASIPSDALRVGDTVVWTSKLDKEYRYSVAELDATWITFETGIQVHRNRFDRGRFEVVRDRGSVVETGADGSERTDIGEKRWVDELPVKEPGVVPMSASESD